MKKKNIIDPDKISKTFGIKYKKSWFYTEIGSNKKEAFQFVLKEKDGKETMDLFFNPNLPDLISLRIETKNGYQSSIDFYNITKVRYIPEYRKVIFESHGKVNSSILSVYWRGQFDLHSRIEEKGYSKTV